MIRLVTQFDASETRAASATPTCSAAEASVGYLVVELVAGTVAIAVAWTAAKEQL